MKVFNETILPRTPAGDFSEMYIGTTMLTAPTATPRKVRAAPRDAMEPAKAHHSEPAMKIRPPMIRVRRRPSQSATRPPSSAPTAAPTSSMEVTHPSWAAVMPNSGLMNSSAPDMTPVS